MFLASLTEQAIEFDYSPQISYFTLNESLDIVGSCDCGYVHLEVILWEVPFDTNVLVG